MRRRTSRPVVLFARSTSRPGSLARPTDHLAQFGGSKSPQTLQLGPMIRRYQLREAIG